MGTLYKRNNKDKYLVRGLPVKPPAWKISLPYPPPLILLAKDFPTGKNRPNIFFTPPKRNKANNQQLSNQPENTDLYHFIITLTFIFRLFQLLLF